jgi:integrase
LPFAPFRAALLRSKPKDSQADALVLVNGVPDMGEFRPDLEKAGIAFLDESRQRLDYHPLRKTFITRLSRNKVHPRLAMELARHSDLKLTMKNYTDATHGCGPVAVAGSNG